ncbi:hypothetical protein GGQ84_000103 [Desulfitispora alkaliphila]|uniref:peptidase MA family metallohydrolase n=1 Tax=Desulfitispora alkaliphila TaxID=622674 RepID=UPI003D1BCC25
MLQKTLILLVIVSLTFGLLATYAKIPKMIAYQGIKTAVQMQLKFNRDNWEVKTRDNFTVYYRPEDQGAVPLVLSVGEEAHEKVNEALNYSPQVDIPIVIYPDRESLNRSFGWDSDVSAMGVYWAGAIKILSPQAWIEEDEPEAVAERFKYAGPVVHEYVHLVVDYKTRGNYPRWFTEGLAQYWEREITGFQFDSPEGSLDQELYPLARMDAEFDNLDNQALAYSQSLALVEFFYLQYGEEKMELLLTELRKGRSFDDTSSIVMGHTMEEYLALFQQWLATELEKEERIAS